MDSETLEEIDGAIHSIHVRNFFCHDNLEVVFHPNINFIVGRNGSGKSAILTALVVGLGGRAAATNRGTSLSSFVKKGTNSATVEIKIKNSSAKAYKPNVYGNYITIIRNINASGGSGYKTKSASGEVISTKFEEVNAIVTAHDIQVDNPISVLNQDDARSFHSATEKKKYALFRKATNLDQTEANYAKAIENCNKAKAIWKKKNEACTELEKEYKKWTASYKQMQSRDEIENKKKELQNEYYWSEVVQLEREASIVQAQYDKQNNKVRKIMDKLNSIEQSFDDNSGKLNTLKAQLEEKSEEKSSLEEELRQLQNEKRDLENTSRKSQHGGAKQREKLKQEKRKIADLEEEIEKIQSGSAASRKEKLENDVAKAKRQKDEMQARYNSAENDANQARANLARHQAANNEAKTDIENHENKIRKLKQVLRDLESQGNDSLGVYGPNMVKLRECVDKAVKSKKFSAPPRGPIGAYLKVKDHKWGGALEHIIGSGMHTFCVNEFNDSKILVNIMKEVYGNTQKPSITCSKFINKVHDVRRTKVSIRGYMCALDALVVNDPVVANFLIDNSSLEKILLVPDHDDAIQKSETVENTPENCAKIVTLDGSEYYPAPNYRCYGGSNRKSRFLHVSTAEKKKQVQAEISELESSLSMMLADKHRLEMEVKSALQMEREADKTFRDLMRSLQQRESAYKSATAALEHHQAPEHQVLQEELDICRKTVEVIQTKLNEVSQHEREHMSKIDDNLSKIKKIDHKLDKVKAEYRLLDDEIYREQMNLDQGVSQRQTLSQALKEEKNNLTQAQLKLKEKTNEVEENIRKALMLCPRIENPREKSVVESELKKTQLKLSSIRSDGLSKAEVGEKLLEIETKYKKTKAMLKRLHDLISEIKKTADDHSQFIHLVQTSIARRVELSFQDILKQRGFEGSLEIDYSSGELKISCWGRDSSQNRLASSTDSLSGGERSYSMVALIMALWECVELPFYFLDEFDVFMDNINRTKVMKLLIEHAKENDNRQFVFLTPQSTYIKADRHIKIHRMADPRRQVQN